MIICDNWADFLGLRLVQGRSLLIIIIIIIIIINIIIYGNCNIYQEGKYWYFEAMLPVRQALIVNE